MVWRIRFTTLNGSFGKVAYDVSESADGIQAVTTSLRGKGGSGDRDGFIFALTLIPTVMFTLGMINVLEHYGALDAARKLLRPLMGIPGNSGLALIASLQSTDAGAAMTRQLKDEGHLTKRETDVFTMFQFTAGAAIVNFFSFGAVLFTLTAMDYIPITVILMALPEFNGANVWLIYVIGVAFVAGRIIHGKSILARSLKGRKQGMYLTFASMVSLVVLNLLYLPFDKLI